MRLPLLIGLCCTAAFVTTLAAQDSTAVPVTAFVVRDSAGIRIAESSAPQWTPETAWRLAEEPSIRFGGDRARGDPFLFRVSGARRLGDGGFLLVNNRNQLRRYDNAGELVWSAMSFDESYRQFQAIASLELRPGDSTGVFNLKTTNSDSSRARYSIYDSEGRLGRVVTVQADPRESWRPVGTLADGSVVAVIAGERSPNRIGYDRPLERVVRSDLSGPTVDTIGVFPGALYDVRGEFRVRMIAAFQQDRFDAVRDASLLTVFTEGFEVHERDSSGRLTGIVRRSFDVKPVTLSYIDAWRDRIVRENPDEPTLLALRFTEAHPLLDRMMADALGNIWIRHARLPEETGPFEWTVFDRDGRWLGSTWTPEQLAVLEIGSDYVLGMWREPESAQALTLYPLIKP
jgi:hypothetical protein